MVQCDQGLASFSPPAEIDVRGIRKRLELSQEDFAKEFGFTIHQIRDWEQAAPVRWTACAPIS